MEFYIKIYVTHYSAEDFKFDFPLPSKILAEPKGWEEIMLVLAQIRFFPALLCK